MTNAPLRIAHRGMPRLARENTLPAFALALDHGAEGIELDVHATSDGVVVVHHDATLRDGTAIATLTHSELARGARDAGFELPALDEVFALVGARATLFVEIKGAGIEALVARSLASHGGRYAVHGFDHSMIARLHHLAPHTRLGILFEDDASTVVAAMRETGALDVWPHYSLVDDTLVDAVHRGGGRVIPWTVNDAGVARSLAAMGVDALCGDDVRIFGERRALAARDEPE